MRLLICRIPSFTFVAFLCADLIYGARPGRDLTDGYALEVNHEVSVSPTEDPEECPTLKEQLEALGFRGEGNPCGWKGIKCRLPCTATRIEVKDGQTISGDIAVLKDMTELQTLDLRSTQVTGDISAVRKLERLEKLQLYITGITGDLKALQNLTKLQVLGMYDTRISGDVSAIQNLESLNLVSVGNTLVSGDIVTFQNHRNLRRLWLDGTQVVGHIAAISKASHLEVLDVSNSGITGDVTHLQGLTRLRSLLLSHTTMEGDIVAFRLLKRLSRLSLSNTKVEGDVASVQNLQKLKELDLSESKVTGDVGSVVMLAQLEVLNLAGTAVSGWITGDSWKGCCEKLRDLNLADAALGPLPVLEGSPEFFTKRPLLPALQTLNVTGCKLNGSVVDLLMPLAQTAVTAIAASGCGLKGAMPNLMSTTVRKDGSLFSSFTTILANSLQVLDLSANSLSSVVSLPAAVRVDLRHNAMPLTLDPSVLQKAVKDSVEIWLDGTKLQNPEDLQSLLQHELRLQQEFSASSGSFACRDVVEPIIRITPQLFMPEVMCQCQPGHEGFATRCSPCPSNTYTMARNSAKCQNCPVNSTSKRATASWELCQCAFGSVQQDAHDQDRLSCQCPVNEALVDTLLGSEHCEPCHKMHLKCPTAGSNASNAQVEEGYMRLRSSSHETFQCLDLSRCNESRCMAGSQGVLCSDCADGHRSSNCDCKPCADVQDLSAKHAAALTLCGACILVVSGTLWTFRHKFGEIDLGLRWTCIAKLLLPQLAILLQLIQLWSILGRLTQVAENSTTEVDSANRDSLVGYMEALQLTSAELQGTFALQCIFHGASVRLASAVATPVAPLALLLTCCCVEVIYQGTGIRVALKVLTVLFIGGAAGTAQLLGCQRTDGTGEAALHELSFRPLVPHLLCTQATWVDWIGRGCAVFYGLVIPCFMAFLFAKQHVVMKQTKTFVVLAEGGSQKVNLQLTVLSDKECLQEHVKQKRLAAAAAAYVAVHVKKCALVSLKDADAVTVQIKEGGENAGGDFDGGFSVDDLVQSEDAAQLRRDRTEMLRYNAIVQMLAERSVLAEMQSKHSDRIMVGATELLCKYVNCGFVWLEVCLKLASAALVSVVGSKDGFWLSVAITLGMALVVGLAQPFMQPQLNALQTCSFICLSMAAVGFHVQRVWWLSRVALVLPVLLLVLLLLRPDSKEAVALRLQEELEKKLPNGQVEVSAEQVRFV